METYLADDVLRPAVERHFEIMGEVLNRLARRGQATAQRITAYAEIIAFRNVLIHGYEAIDHRRVGDAVVNHLPLLHAEVCKLLGEAQ